MGYSVSIETQEAILRQYCNQNHIKIYDVYIDDGVSGGNYNRPNFNRLKEDMDNHVINCVITKDLSRLGRDHIVTDYLMEIYFPSMGIRYIAVDDNVDTMLKPDNEMIPFKNLFNDWYLRDLSKKIKNAKQQRTSMGLYTHGQAPYGYKKSAEDKNKLVIDEDADEIVRLIFSLAIEGNGVVRICRELESRNIVKPSVYKALRGDNRFYKHNEDDIKRCIWQPSIVQKILKDVTYLGKLDGHRIETVNYKTKQKASIPKKDHIIVDNTHEPIISKDDFDLVQRLMLSRYKPQVHNYENIFKRVIHCGDCGYKMHIVKMQRDGGDILAYRCLKYYHYPDKCAKGNYINSNVLKDIVEKDLRRIISYFRNDKKCAELIRSKLDSSKQTDRLNNRIQQNIKRKNEIKNLFASCMKIMLMISWMQTIIKIFWQSIKKSNQ